MSQNPLDDYVDSECEQSRELQGDKVDALLNDDEDSMETDERDKSKTADPGTNTSPPPPTATGTSGGGGLGSGGKSAPPGRASAQLLSSISWQLPIHIYLTSRLL
jgi:hypothetical protein